MAGYGLGLSGFLPGQVNAGRGQVQWRHVRVTFPLGAGIPLVIADLDNAVGISPGVIGLPLPRPDKTVPGQLFAIRVVFSGVVAGILKLASSIGLAQCPLGR